MKKFSLILAGTPAVTATNPLGDGAYGDARVRYHR